MAPPPVLLVRPGDAPVVRTAIPACRRVLVPLDGSPAAEAAIGPASELADALGVGLLLVQAVYPLTIDLSLATAGLLPTVGQFVDEALSYASAQGRSYLTSIAKRLERPGLSVHTRVRIGLPMQVLEEEVETIGATVVVVVSDHPRGSRPWALGGMADRLLRAGAGALVLVVNSHPLCTHPA
jgi:nucleotide-binding universal stress UspA family protein